jgi:D-amino-acid dehydrogenase
MSSHVVIIGGGVIGRCTAYYAAQRGHRVTVLERNAPDFPGCSFGNAGFITPSHFVPLAAPGMVKLGFKWMLNPESPFYVKPSLHSDLMRWGWRFYQASNPKHVERSAPLLRDLNLLSRTCFEELAEATGNEFALVKKGCLMLCNTEERLHEEKQMMVEGRRLGLKVEALTPDDLRKLEPDVRMNVVGAVHFLDDCHLIPDRFMTSLNRLLEQSSVQRLWGTEVSGWKTNGASIEGVRTKNGDVVGDEYVVCGGSWSGNIVRELKVRLPLQAGKGYSLTLSHPRRLPNVPAICTEARLAVTPMGRTLRIGGTMEIAGLNSEINPARVRGILKSVYRYYPDFSPEDFRGIQPWCGLRPLSPDGLPYVGRLTQYKNLSVGTGHAMLGLSLGPITGKLLAELLSGENPGVDTALLSPMRYA